MAEVTAVKPEETLGGGLVEKMAAEVEIKPKADIKLSPFTVFKAAEVRPRFAAYHHPLSMGQWGSLLQHFLPCSVCIQSMTTR